MATAYFLVPAVPDGQGGMTPKYADDSRLVRYSGLLFGGDTVDRMVPLIAQRLGVKEQAVRNKIPSGKLYLLKVETTPAIIEQAASRSDVLQLQPDEVVAALNRRFDREWSAQRWAKFLKSRAEEGTTKEYTPPERNYQRTKYEELRQFLDGGVMQLVDDLSAAYYGGEPYKWNGNDFGVLTLIEFQLLHGYFATHLYWLAFHAANQALAESDGFPDFKGFSESEYRYIEDPTGAEPTIDRIADAQSYKAKLEAEGIETDITLDIEGVSIQV